MIGDESTRGLAACAKPSRSRYMKKGCRCAACRAAIVVFNATRTRVAPRLLGPEELARLRRAVGYTP